MIRSSLVLPFVAGLAALPGCTSGETTYPVIPTNKSKEEFQKDVDNPFGVPIKESKSKKRKR